MHEYLSILFALLSRQGYFNRISLMAKRRLKKGRPTHSHKTFNALRNPILFPSGFDGTSKVPFGTEPPRKFTPEHLRQLLMIKHQESYHTQYINVVSAALCRQSGILCHSDFILLNIQDAKDSDLTNTITLGRDARKHAFVNNPVHSSEALTDYRFRISSDGSQSSLLEHKGIAQYRCLEEITFDPGSSFSFLKLVVLADAVASTRTSYKAVPSQSDWFVSCVWRCIHRVFENSKLEITTTSTPGASLLASSPDDQEVTMILKTVEAANDELQTNIQQIEQQAIEFSIRQQVLAEEKRRHEEECRALQQKLEEMKGLTAN